MSKRGYHEIRIKILDILDKSPKTYAELERALATNTNTIRLHCKDLEIFGAVKITKKEKHEANGKPYFIVEITADGRNALKKLKD